MKSKKHELRNRAISILGLNVDFTIKELVTNFRRQIRLVNPNSANSEKVIVPGFSNSEITRLIIQAYELLRNKKSPTSMLENDLLMILLLGAETITPISETLEDDKFDLVSFYDFEGGWPEVSEEELIRQKEYKFRGI